MIPPPERTVLLRDHWAFGPIDSVCRGAAELSLRCLALVAEDFQLLRVLGP